MNGREPQLSKTRVLIVEDEPLIAFDNEHALIQAGYIVVATVDRFRDAEAVIGGEAPNEAGVERWQLRLWWKPFVNWIWYGGVLIALGGVFALLGRVGTDLRRRSARSQIAIRKGDAAA